MRLQAEYSAIFIEGEGKEEFTGCPGRFTRFGREDIIPSVLLLEDVFLLAFIVFGFMVLLVPFQSGNKYFGKWKGGKS